MPATLLLALLMPTMMVLMVCVWFLTALPLGRSAIPVVTCLLAILVESRYPSGQELAALITLTLGVMLAVWQGTVTGKPYAIVFCLVGTVCNGAMMTFSGKVLR